MSAARLQGSAGARRPGQLRPEPRVRSRARLVVLDDLLPLRACLMHAMRAPTCCAEAAHEAVQIFEVPDNAARVHEVQQQCAGDLGKFFMMMIPLATELVASVIQKYGFEANQAGAMAFVAELQKHQGDAEIAGLVCVLAAGGPRARAGLRLPACPCWPSVAGLPVLSRAGAPARVEHTWG